MATYLDVGLHSEDETAIDLEGPCNSQQNLLQSISNLSQPHCLFTPAHATAGSYGAKEKRKLLWATLFTVAFMIAEFVGGYLSGSLAIMTDAAHLLSDCISFMIALISIWVSNRPPDDKMSFGYRRMEVLGALLSILGIWVLTVVLVVMSARRLLANDYDIDADTMIIVAILGVVMNIATAFILHGSCSVHGHSHGHGHGHSHAHSHGHSHISRRVRTLSTPARTPSPLHRKLLGCDEKKCDKMEQLIIQNYTQSPTGSPRTSRPNSRHNSFALANELNQRPTLDYILHNARLKLSKENLRQRMSIDAAFHSPDLISSNRLHYSRVHTEDNSSADGEAEDSATEETCTEQVHHVDSHDDDHNNLNVRAAIIHVIGDFIQSIGVLIAAIIIKLAPHLKMFDPICTFLFSLIVLVTTVRIFKDSMRIIMDAVPLEISLGKLSAELASVHGVKTVHDLNVWSVSTGWHVMTVHLMIDPLVDTSEILVTANQIARNDFHIKHATIQIEKIHF